MRFWRQPLFVFVVVGAGLFALSEIKDQRNSRTIVVSQDSLLEYIQLQSKNFDRDAAVMRLQRLDESSRQELIDQIVREGALYRKAMELGFDQDDYIIRRRLVQKVEFMAEGASKDVPEPGEEELRSYFRDHADLYRIDAWVTFTHVYLQDKSRNEVQALLSQMNASAISFHEARTLGDRFLYHANYVERNFDEVSDHFSREMAENLFELPPDENQWAGPFNSSHGWHLVLLTAKQSARLPAFEEVRERVLIDARAELQRQQKEAVLAEILSEYEVRIEAGN